MAEYFHCAPIKLGMGSVIEPGNWGRLVRAKYVSGVAEGTSRIIFEMAYESMRLAFNPDAPSRLDCVFACPTLETALFYRDNHADGNIVYRVASLDESRPVHVTSWSLYGLGNGLDYQQSEARIRAYWTEPPSENFEVLIGGAVRVLEALA